MHAIRTSLTKTALVLAVLVASTLTLTAQAHAAGYYGQSARTVATKIGCKNFYSTHGRSNGMTLGSGVCWLRGRRVNVLTYRGPAHQQTWNNVGKSLLGPNHYWATGTGANIIARNGNRPAAVVGARALPGRVMHG